MRRYAFASVVFVVAGVLAGGGVLAADPIVYSGPNRNIVYSQHSYPPTLSLFGAPGTWDDMDLSMFVYESPGYRNEYQFGNMLQVHGNYVQFAQGSYFFDIKRFSQGQWIGPGLTYSGNSYKDFRAIYRSSIHPTLARMVSSATKPATPACVSPTAQIPTTVGSRWRWRTTIT